MAKREIYNHTPTPVPNNYHNKIPTWMVFSMGEVVMRRVKKSQIKIKASL